LLVGRSMTPVLPAGWMLMPQMYRRPGLIRC
jgi:hypothetical protein